MEPKKHFDKVASKYSLNRKKWILGWIVSREKKVLLDFLNIKKGDLILDVGCGDGFYSILMKEAGAKVYGIDISNKMVDFLKEKGINCQFGDVQNFNLNKKFDKILCAGVLEFLDSPYKAIESIKKHLKKNGFLVILYPPLNFWGLLYKMYHYFHGLNIKLFTKQKFFISGFFVESHYKANPWAHILCLRYLG